MKHIVIFLLVCITHLSAAQTPAEALKRLKAGNMRFVKEELLHPDRTHERRLSLSESQSPYAVIVTCSDSRVIPEIIFDEGLGDLFVIRVAGNVIGATELESIQYAVDHLDPSIVVVMGHEKCGAVDAVVQGQTHDIPEIASYIEPSVIKARSQRSKDLLRQSIELNALRMQSVMLKSSIINKKAQDHSVGIYSAYYNLQSGAVDFLNNP